MNTLHLPSPIRPAVLALVCLLLALAACQAAPPSPPPTQPIVVAASPTVTAPDTDNVLVTRTSRPSATPGADDEPSATTRATRTATRPASTPRNTATTVAVNPSTTPSPTSAPSATPQPSATRTIAPPTSVSTSAPTPTYLASGIIANVSPNPAQPDDILTLTWDACCGASVQLRYSTRSGQYVQETLPLQGQKTLAVADLVIGLDGVFLDFDVLNADGSPATDSGGNELYAYFRIPVATAMQVISFEASPNPVARGGPVTFSWNVAGAESVTISYLDGQLVQGVTVAENLPPAGSITADTPLKFRSGMNYSLFATDANGVLIAAELNVAFVCAFANYAAPECPAIQTTTPATYQTFELGFMLWRQDEDMIYVFYNDPDEYGLRSWRRFPDNYVDGDPLPPMDAPPAGLQTPVRGFGLLWATHADVRQALGFATAAETGYISTIEITMYTSGRYLYEDTYLSLPTSQYLWLEAEFYDADAGRWSYLQ